MKKSITTLFTGTIRLYQLCISPFTGSCCRFVPSCSEYMLQAIKKHGPCRGIAMGCRRLLKCGPWHPGGFDDVA